MMNIEKLEEKIEEFYLMAEEEELTCGLDFFENFTSRCISFGLANDAETCNNIFEILKVNYSEIYAEQFATIVSW